jgi:rod shape-determining protein MreD
MKRALRMALTVLVFYVLQTSVFTSLRVSVIQPDMMAVLLACLSAYTGTYGTFCAGAVSGLLLDTFVGHVMGLYVVLYPLMGYVCAKIRGRTNRMVEVLFRRHWKAGRHLIVHMLICLLIVAFRETIFVTYMFLNGVDVTYLHVFRIVACMLASALMTIPADWLVRRLLQGKKRTQAEA